VELFAGLQAGMCIGVGNAAIATGLQSMSRSWRAHLSSSSAAPPMLSHLTLSAGFVVFGALLNGAHPIFANRGYQHGRVVLISTYTSLVSMGTGVFIGMAVLDESWPAAPRMSLLRQLAFLLLFWGVLTLNGPRISNALARPAARPPAVRVSSAGASAGSPVEGRAAGHKRHASGGAPEQLHSPSHGQLHSQPSHGHLTRKVAREAGREPDS